MDIKIQTNTLRLITRLSDRTNRTEPCIPFVPQKPEFIEKYEPVMPFETASPEQVGISSRYIADFYREIDCDESLDMHGITILKDGKKIAQGSFGAYRNDVWHVTHSFSKSVTSLAIGMLIDEGVLTTDTKITKIFEKRASPLTLISHRAITVEHLLTMTSGILFNEAGSVTEENWVKAFLESTITDEPGKKFSYNSMNTYMLSAAVKELTEQGLCEFLDPRLFKPLGIERYFWEKCPKGIEKGGWGLYLMPDDMAKIGQLYMNRGEWHGNRIVSSEWIDEAASEKVATPKENGNFNYGYQIWTGRNSNSFLLNGMFGQNALGMRDSGIIIVTTGSNSEIFQQSNLYRISEKYFGSGFSVPAGPLPADKKGEKELKKTLDSLGSVRRKAKPLVVSKKPLRLFSKLLTKKKLPPQCSALAGREYLIAPEYSRNIGIMPQVIQIVQNNYTQGLDSISFALENGIFSVVFTEGSSVHKFPVGFFKPEYATLDFGGEHYLVGTSGFFASNEDGADVLKLRISFLEAGSARFIRMVFDDRSVTVTLTETPCGEFIFDSIADVMDGLGEKRLLGAITSRIDREWLKYKTDGLFSPTVEGKQKPD